MTWLFSIISQQAIPNLLLIKELSGRYDKQVFLSTTRMEAEKRSEFLERSLEMEPNSIPRIVVREDDLEDITCKLNAFDFCNDSVTLVNLTGGTKLMSIGVYEFFKSRNSKIYYTPIGKNSIVSIYPDKTQGINIGIHLGLKEYLTAYGLHLRSNPEVAYPESHTLSFFRKFRNVGFKRESCPDIFKSHNFPDPKDKAYYSGGWFEEFIYFKIKRSLNLSENSIKKGIKIFRDESDISIDNEYDIMFIHKNELYVIECKATLGSGKAVKEKLDHAMYKLAAISRDFGLQVNSFLFTLQNLNEFSRPTIAQIEKRQKILGIRNILDARFFSDDYNITQYFSKM